MSLLQVVVKDDSGFSGLCQMELPPGRTVECRLTGSRVQDLVGLEYEPKLVYCLAVAIGTWLGVGDHSLPSAFSSSLHLSYES